MEATLIRPAIDRFRRLCGIWRAASCGAAGLLAFSGMVSCNFGVEGGSSALSDHFSGISAATTLSPTSIKVSWQPQDGYTSYSVFSSSQDSPVATFTTGESYTVTGLRPNSTYSFSVVGTDSNGNQYGMGNQISGTTWQNFLGPTQATVVDSQTINLAWSYNPGPSFNIYYQAGSPPTITGGLPAALLAPQLVTSQPNGYNVSGLQPNTTYYFMVAAKYADGTDSYQDSGTSFGTLSATFTGIGKLKTLPTITSQSTLDTTTPPSFTVSGGSSTYVLTFYLFDPTKLYGYGTQLASALGNGTFPATTALPAGTQDVVIDICDMSQYTCPNLTGGDATAAVNGITVAPTLPNDTLKTVSATTPSALSPLPTIAGNSISLGPFPLFTVSGAQPGYQTTLYSSSNVILANTQGNGTLKVGASTPLPQGPNTLYAVVSYGGQSATINGIQVRVKTTDPLPVTIPTTLNSGSGAQGLGQKLVVGDFNCDGYPDIAASAPYGQNGAVYVYYGTPTGLDFSAAPSPTPSGPTKPLFITTVDTGYSITQGYSNWGNGFAANIAVGNLNGFKNPLTGIGCSDLVVSKTLIGSNGVDGGTIYVFYGSPNGLQINGGNLVPGSMQTNTLTCVGNSANSCSPVHLDYWSAGLPFTATGGYDFATQQTMGVALAVGDVDGDGYDDIVAASPEADFETQYGGSGAMFLWRGTPGGVSPNFTQILFPTNLTHNGGTTIDSGFGSNVTIGHFITSQKGSGGPSDIAVNFNALSPAGATGISSPQTQSGIMVIPGSSTPPYLALDGTNHVNQYTLIAPPQCNNLTNYASLGSGSWWLTKTCGTYVNTLTHADLNGDGWDDVVFSDPYAGGATGYGLVFVYYGGPSSANFAAQAAQGTIPTISNTCPQVNSGCTTPQIFYPTNLSFTMFGWPVVNLGDTNNDGYEDLGIGAPNATVNGRVNSGFANIYHGGPNGLSSVAAVTVSPSKTAGSFFGMGMAGAKFESSTGQASFLSGATNYDDVVVGAVGDSPNAASISQGVVINNATPDGSSQELGTLNIYSNASGLGVSLTNPTTELAPTNTMLGTGVVPTFSFIAGDINGDGYADIVTRINLPAPLAGSNYGAFMPTSLSSGTQIGFLVFYGSASGINTTSAAPAYNPVNPTDPQLVTNSLLFPGLTSPPGDPQMASSLLPAGDTNGDGFVDLVISNYYNGFFGSWSGSTILFYGSATGLIVAPTPVAVPYDTAHRPSLNPMIVGSDFFAVTNPGMGYSQRTVGLTQTAGDFNGDGYSDIALLNINMDIVIIYGSSLGLVAGGDVYFNDGTQPRETNWSAAPAYDKLPSPPVANCSGVPLVCDPTIILHTANPGVEGIFAAGDMDGDGTDELISINTVDPNWGAFGGCTGYWGTISIYYGSTTNGINPNLFVNLRIPSTQEQRWLGGPAAFCQSFGGDSASAFDINKDGLADLVFTSAYENTGYIVYGVSGPGTSPTMTSGAYLEQGVCQTSSGTPTSSYPCYVNMTTVTTPDYLADHLLNLSATTPNSCSAALRSCNPARFALPTRISLSGGASAFSVSEGIMSPGDITGDGYADVVLSRINTVGGYDDYGQLYIYSGSVNGLQVSMPPSIKPNCYVGGYCDPLLITPPMVSPQIPVNTVGVSFGTYGWQHPPGEYSFDVDGDGYNDFLIIGQGLNSVGPSGNVVGLGMGGFYLFH